MIGSISKIRPCGHHHYYKYAHVKTGGNKSNSNRYDFTRISREFYNDVDADNYWRFSLNNLETVSGCCFENGRFVGFIAETPNLIRCGEMFTQDNGISSPPVKEIMIDYDKIEHCTSLFYGFRITDLPENFNPKTRNFYFLLGGGCSAYIANAHGNVFPYYEILNQATSTAFLFRSCACYISDEYTFEHATGAGGMFYSDGYWNCVLECPRNLSFKNVTDINHIFYNCKASTFTYFQTKDEMSKLTNANHAFYGCTYLRQLYPDYESFSLPKLTTADEMFRSCILDKPSTLKLSDALPTHTDNAAHKITIGIHIDHKYDPEINMALKRLQNTYITPIEECGSSLTEEITEDKGWTLTVQWNGTATENAYPLPSTDS